MTQEPTPWKLDTPISDRQLTLLRRFAKAKGIKDPKEVIHLLLDGLEPWLDRHAPDVTATPNTPSQPSPPAAVESTEEIDNAGSDPEINY